MSDDTLSERALIRAAQTRIKKRQNKNVPYDDYLNSPDWKRRRGIILRRAGYKCELCGASGVPLDIHHLTYERRGNEKYTDLIAICRKCHEAKHNITQKE